MGYTRQRLFPALRMRSIAVVGAINQGSSARSRGFWHWAVGAWPSRSLEVHACHKPRTGFTNHFDGSEPLPSAAEAAQTRLRTGTAEAVPCQIAFLKPALVLLRRNDFGFATR